MDRQVAIEYLEQIIRLSFNSEFTANRMVAEIHSRRDSIPVRAILQECQTKGDNQLPEEVGPLIKELIFHYG